MINYSYPFKNDKEWNKFWTCFDDIQETEIMEVKSNAIINNKFCKARVYYITGKFNRKWKEIKPDGDTYTFQIGEHENTHGHFINCDLTEFLGLNQLCPWQHSFYWACSSAVDSSRRKEIHYPTIEYNDVDCFPNLWNMIKGLRMYDGKSLESMNMKDHWDVEKMHWVGPFAIGHLRGLQEFEEFHQSRFLEFIPNRDGSVGKNKVIFSDGNYAALMGHPSMTCTHKGEYFGFKPEKKQPRIYVMDFWTCDGDKLIDNWCQIDMIDLFRSINKEYEEFIDDKLHYTG